MTRFTQVIERLAATIESRKGADASTSYTAQLLGDMDRAAKKLGEEAVELALASVQNDKAHITAEAADVLYHLLVLLEATNVPLADVMAELERRKGTGGIAEKAARKPG